MFLKTALTPLAVGALSVSALTIPVARSPAPEPESQELDAWMLKRDLSYDLFSREVQALDELFSREPQDDSHLNHLKPAKPDVRFYNGNPTPVRPARTDTLPAPPPPPPPPPPRNQSPPPRVPTPPIRTGTPF